MPHHVGSSVIWSPIAVQPSCQWPSPACCTNRVIEICRENGVELPVFELQGNRFAASTSTIDVTLPFARRKSPNGVDFLAGVCPETCVHCHCPDGCQLNANSWPVVIATGSGPRKFPRAATTTGKSAGAISNRDRNREGRTESWDGDRPPEPRACGASPRGRGNGPAPPRSVGVLREDACHSYG